MLTESHLRSCFSCCISKSDLSTTGCAFLISIVRPPDRVGVAAPAARACALCRSYDDHSKTPSPGPEFIKSSRE